MLTMPAHAHAPPQDHPSRPGKQACEFYCGTGYCKYGDACVYDHPRDAAVQLTAQVSGPSKRARAARACKC